LPEDGHHSPHETPEAWLVAQEAAQREKQPQPQQHKAGARHGRKLRVPYLGLDVTPELVAISMGVWGVV
jgi:hypothetical protein